MRRYNVLHPTYLSFFSKSLYQDVGRNWKGLAFLYLALLLAICWIPDMFKVHYGVSQFMVNDAPAFIEQVPEIMILEGEVFVSVPEPHTIVDPKSGNPFAIIDTTGQIISLDDTEARMLLTKTEVIIEKSTRETRVYDLSDIEAFHVDQTRIYGWSEKVADWFAVAAYPFALLGSFLYRVVQVLIYALIGLIFVKVNKSDLKYEALLSLSIVSITPVIILDTVVGVLGLSVPSFGLLCFLIAMAYLYYGVYANTKEHIESN